MISAELKHCGKMPDAREELNRSVRDGRMGSRHSIKSLGGMGSSSHDLGAEIRMHSFTVNYDAFSNEKKATAVVPVTSVEATCSEAMLALSFCTLLVWCLMKILGRSALGLLVGNILGGCLFESVLTIWCSSPLEDSRAILSVLGVHLAMCTSFETLCFACLYKSLKIVNFVFLHFLSA